MSTKHVPREDEDEEYAEQLGILLQKLAGSDALRTCRGFFGKNERDIRDFLNGVSNSSPNQAAHAWDEMSLAVRQMLILAAQLGRDGLEDARRLLLLLLTEPGYILPGEIIPLEDSETYTILMLQPAKMLRFLKWVLQQKVHEAGPCLNHKLGYLRTWSDETKAILHLFDVKQVWEIDGRREHPRQVANTVRGAIELSHHEELGDWKDLLYKKMGTDTKTERGFALCLARHPDHEMLANRDEYMYYDTVVAYAIKAKQSEVLSFFPRNADIATWVVEAPNVWDGYFKVGLHPESEEDALKDEFRSLLSKGFSFGLGACVLGRGQECNYSPLYGPRDRETGKGERILLKYSCKL